MWHILDVFVSFTSIICNSFSQCLQSSEIDSLFKLQGRQKKKDKKKD